MSCIADFRLASSLACLQHAPHAPQLKPCPIFTTPYQQDVEKRLTRPIPALAADLSLPAEIAARVAGTQAGSGGATQYGQQRGGGVSKDVMERVQVRRSVNLFFRQNHSLLLMLDSRGCLAVGVSKGCDGAGAGAEDGLGCLRSQLCFLL